MYALVVGDLIVAVIAWFVVSNSRYYDRLFSEAHFRQLYDHLLQAIEAAKAKDADERPSTEDGTAFVTDAGLGVCVTFTPNEDASHTLHVSFSQVGRSTTHSLCERLAFLVLAILWGTKGKLDPYYADSGVHHMALRLESTDLVVQDFDAAYSRYQTAYVPVHFRHEEVGTA